MNWRKWIPFAILFRPDPPITEQIKLELKKLESQRIWHQHQANLISEQIAELQTWMLGGIK